MSTTKQWIKETGKLIAGSQREKITSSRAKKTDLYRNLAALNPGLSVDWGVYSHVNRIRSLVESYQKNFGDNEIAVISSPGRVELVGNYQDNLPGGHTLSAAITRDVLIVAGRNKDGMVNAISRQANELLEKKLDDLPEAGNCDTEGWLPFPIGVCRTVKSGYHGNGFAIEGYPEFSAVNMIIEGEVPLGGGCSSSAALETGIVKAIDSLYGYNMRLDKMAAISKVAENHFKGKGCGFLDQYSCLAGGVVFLAYDDKGIPVHSRNHQMEAPWFSDHGLITVMADAGHHGRDEDYNSVKSDLKKFAAKMPDTFFRYNENEFWKVYGDANERAADEGAFKRGLFFIQEYNRVLTAYSAYLAGDDQTFGRMMTESGWGSRHLNRNTTPALDEACDLANRPGSYAKVNGGGFGGGIVIMTDHPAEMRDEMIEQYGGANVQLCDIRPGTTELRL